MTESYPIAPNNPKPTEAYLKALVGIVNNIMRGKQNNTGSVTLNASATTTAVTNIFCGGNSTIHLSPTTANAAAEIGNGTLYITAAKQSFTITHANNAQTDRTYSYTIHG